MYPCTINAEEVETGAATSVPASTPAFSRCTIGAEEVETGAGRFAANASSMYPCTINADGLETSASRFAANASSMYPCTINADGLEASASRFAANASSMYSCTISEDELISVGSVELSRSSRAAVRAPTAKTATRPIQRSQRIPFAGRLASSVGSNSRLLMSSGMMTPSGSSVVSSVISGCRSGVTSVVCRSNTFINLTPFPSFSLSICRIGARRPGDGAKLKDLGPWPCSAHGGHWQ